MPGPHDYHVVTDGDTITLEPGLGRDEPSEDAKNEQRARGLARMQRMKDEIAAQAAELTEKEKAALAREQAAIAREEAAIKKEREIDQKLALLDSRTKR